MNMITRGEVRGACPGFAEIDVEIIRGGSDSIPYPCNAKAACLGLATLPIENPPASVDQEWVKRGGAAPDEDLAKWKGWWNRIASGRGTYRFKGDPTE